MSENLRIIAALSLLIAGFALSHFRSQFQRREISVALKPNFRQRQALAFKNNKTNTSLVFILANIDGGIEITARLQQFPYQGRHSRQNLVIRHLSSQEWNPSFAKRLNHVRFGKSVQP